MSEAGWNYRDDGDDDKAVTTAGSAPETPKAAPEAPKAVGGAPIAPVAPAAPVASADDLDLEGKFMDALRSNDPPGDPVPDNKEPLRPTPPSSPPPSSLMSQILGPTRSADTRRVRSPSPLRGDAATPAAISTTRPKKRPKSVAPADLWELPQISEIAHFFQTNGPFQESGHKKLLCISYCSHME